MSDLQTLWDEFLAEWPLERVKNMTLEDYVGFKDKTTFTYWVETKTQSIANIKGSPSYKFGIFKRNPNKDVKEKVGTTQGDEYSWYSRFGDSEREAFIKIRETILTVIKAAKKNDLDAIENASLANMFKWKIAFLYQERDKPSIVNVFSKDKLDELTNLSGKPSFSEYYQELMFMYEPERYNNIAEYGKFLWSQLDDESSDQETSQSQTTYDISMNNEKSPLNQILYGPPGTGKTYQTTEAAVKAAEPEFSWFGDREKLKEKYDKLVLEKRIRFVTFHQSYGYEEFVEGLQARETDSGNVKYVTESGVFKCICDDATSVEVDTESGINLEGRVWKLSIERTKKNPAKTYCLENNIGAIGWGNTGDLSLDKRNEYFHSRGKNDQNSLTYFSQDMIEGDIVLCIDSNTSVEAIGVIIDEYKFQENGLPTRQDYRHQISIKWLAKNFSVDFKELNGNKQFNLPACYPLSRLSVSDVLKHLVDYDVEITTAKTETNLDNYVLIIDEINRGNISKIFGELITLIEPSKRSGLGDNGKENLEALTVNLSHSPNKKFSVPNNLYLIGTMNTADRSLAMMDTALRRRFDFVEMMPKPELFNNVIVKEIDLEALLYKMNQRIEVLYDREHTLGHAFFMPVKALVEDQDKAFNELKSVFKNKIIPLLEEYFFEDWNKIRLVLGDNQKAEDLQFINEEKLSFDILFGNDHGLNSYQQDEKSYRLLPFDNDVWNTPEAYSGIYKATKED